MVSDSLFDLTKSSNRATKKSESDDYNAAVSSINQESQIIEPVSYWIISCLLAVYPANNLFGLLQISNIDVILNEMINYVQTVSQNMDLQKKEHRDQLD